MEVLAAINAAATLLATANAALAGANQISALISKAQSEGRNITPEELASIVHADDDAKAQFDAAIATALNAGQTGAAPA